ncbi:hypothetical protein TIFTF001_027064 [Ficus carica]|uniref:Rhodanese domain-containing protein n=1 Tax=Ficus carica TaxID=3494 RepID=A0AA88DMA4_FICCA|nr:hypothetical protein TIFTF001_027064 [Ficus carica]
MKPRLSLSPRTRLFLLSLKSTVVLPFCPIFKVEKTIDQVQQVGSSVFDATQRVLEVVINALKPAFPVAQQAGEQVLKLASPVVSEASKKAQEAIQNAGVDTEPVAKADVLKMLLKRISAIISKQDLDVVVTVADAAQQTTKVIEAVKPIASSTVETIFSAEPLTLAGSAGALFIAYLLFPPIWSVISYNLRGYQGQLTAAQTLDLVSSKNYVLIDIRSEKDKDKVGIPRLPSSAKSKLISIPLEELPSKLRGVVKSTKKLEAEIAAVKISYLKKVNEGSNIIILDSYSDSAKMVARALTSLGFKNCWVVADGFSGGRGWLQSRLGTDSYNLSFAEVLSPSRVIPAVKRFGTTGSTAPSGQKLLPE